MIKRLPAYANGGIDSMRKICTERRASKRLNELIVKGKDMLEGDKKQIKKNKN